MKKIFLLVAAAISLCGCTTLHVKQIDESPSSRKITSDFSASAWFSSAQTIAKFRATMSDKTTSFGGSALEQHGATNAIEALNAIARILEALRPAP